MLVTGLVAIPVHPERGTARQWALQELSQKEYQDGQPGLGERVLRWFWDLLNGTDLTVNAPPLPALILIVMVIALVVIYAVRRSGGLHGTARRQATTVLPERHTTAADHRAAAQRHADAQAWGSAVVERFRAIARELEERALLSPQPGRTAREVARDGGTARPDLAADLLVAAGFFDDVSYGQLTVDRSADQTLRDLDDRLRMTRSVPRS